MRMTTAMSLLNIIIKLRKLLVCLLCSFCIFNILKYTICVIVYCDVVNVQPRFNLSNEIIKVILNNRVSIHTDGNNSPLSLA